MDLSFLSCLAAIGAHQHRFAVIPFRKKRQLFFLLLSSLKSAFYCRAMWTRLRVSPACGQSQTWGVASRSVLTPPRPRKNRKDAMIPAPCPHSLEFGLRDGGLA